MTNPPGEGKPPEGPDEPRPWEQQPWDQPGASRPGEPSPGASEPGEYQPGYWEQQGQPPYQQSYPPPYQQPYPPGYPGQVQYAPDHPRATTSLILGILGVVLCQFVAPFAWWMGKRTLDEIDASQGTVGGRGAAQAGYILGIVGTVLLLLGVVLLVVYVLGMIALFSTGTATN